MNDKLPIHHEARRAKNIDVFNRLAQATQAVYLNEGEERARERRIVEEAFSTHIPKTEDGLKAFYGDLHNHTCYSDGWITPEEFLKNMEERVDFCALTDHDHGGVWKDTLYTDKWRQLCETIASHYKPGKFTPFIGYERDSYPWYDNMIVYFKDHKQPLLECAVRGETNSEELAEWFAREDLFIASHDTNMLGYSTNFVNRSVELLPHGFEIISSGDCAEYFNHPLNHYSSIRGGNFQDALASGGHMAVIGGSDSHDGSGAVDTPEWGFPVRYPGMTGVWAKENTLEAIFEALKQRRTWAFMGPQRVTLDFRINEERMGSCIEEAKDAPGRWIYFAGQSEVPAREITFVKNNQDYCVMKLNSTEWQYSFVDYERELEEDWYYVRVALEDGRQAWTSPCWVKGKEY